MRRTARRALAVVVLLLACGLSAGTPPALAAPAPIRLRVMTFNIQYGARLSPNGARDVVKAIRAADADVVGLQEPFGNTRRIARLLGWYAAPRLHMVSRFPIVFPGGSSVAGNPGGHIPQGVWGYLLLGNGDVAAVANTHTPSYPDGVKMMMQGASRADILAVERRTRVAWIRPHLDATATPIAGGIPTFFTGDFNSPSQLDWTPAAVQALGWQPPSIHPPGRRVPLKWPTTVAMADAGFRDSYREVHPDPVADPAITYCVVAFPACAKWDSWDRIDYVFDAGPITALRSQIVGEGGPYTDIVSRPWPTDHRSVVSTFDVTPVTPPPFAAPLDERVFVGRNAQIAFHDPAAAGRSMGLWSSGADPAADPAAVSATVPTTDDGTVALDTTGLTPGAYTAALLDNGGAEIARSSIAVVDHGATPTITTSAHHYGRGEPISVSWTGGTGNRYDWLELNRDCFDPTACPLRQWRYIDGRVFGTARFTKGSTGTWPLRPGRYIVSLCVDDDYRCIATSARFRIG
jgi:endonuclease/exonuclease/phosphatase family metal-dependent hydrolase